MSEINLDDWAARVGASKRSAQRWAKERLIPAKKKKLTKSVVKTWFGYVIDETVRPPELSR